MITATSMKRRGVLSFSPSLSFPISHLLFSPFSPTSSSRSSRPLRVLTRPLPVCTRCPRSVVCLVLCPVLSRAVQCNRCPFSFPFHSFFPLFVSSCLACGGCVCVSSVNRSLTRHVWWCCLTLRCALARRRCRPCRCGSTARLVLTFFCLFSFSLTLVFSFPFPFPFLSLFLLSFSFLFHIYPSFSLFSFHHSPFLTFVIHHSPSSFPLSRIHCPSFTVPVEKCILFHTNLACTPEHGRTHVQSKDTVLCTSLYFSILHSTPLCSSMLFCTFLCFSVLLCANSEQNKGIWRYWCVFEAAASFPSLEGEHTLVPRLCGCKVRIRRDSDTALQLTCKQGNFKFKLFSFEYLKRFKFYFPADLLVYFYRELP